MLLNFIFNSMFTLFGHFLILLWQIQQHGSLGWVEIDYLLVFISSQQRNILLLNDVGF